MNNNRDSVYNLLTKLCERYSQDPAKIKRFRAIAFEIILRKKRYRILKRDIDCKEDVAPYNQLLVWICTLNLEYEMKEHGQRLMKCKDELKELYKDDMDSFNRIIQFLMYFKNIPKPDDDKLSLSSLPSFEENINFDQIYRLPDHLNAEFEEFERNQNPSHPGPSRLFQLSQKPSTSKSMTKSQPKPQNESRIMEETYETIMNREEEPPDIWSLAANAPQSNFRTWFSLGKRDPKRVKPTIPECPEVAQVCIENLISVLYYKLTPPLQVLPMSDLIKALKFLLIGIPSDFFILKDNQFEYQPTVSIKGITPETLGKFSRHFILSGNCYRALRQLAAETDYPNNGFIFKEFCDSINRFLDYYRVAANKCLPDSANAFQYEVRTEKMRRQIVILAKISKVHPEMRDDIPNGVTLLNYLYLETLKIQPNLVMSFYSILYSCCQVYVFRFLTPWIMDGEINDPYNEFFVKFDQKFILTRGRTYWTRTFFMVHNFVPDFLVNLSEDIFNVGRAMNLLKICHPKSKLCRYLMGEKPLILSFCITHSQLTALKLNTTNYYLDLYEEIGWKIDLDQILLRNQENTAQLQLIAKKRASTLKRIELERQKKFEKQRIKRQEEMNSLKEQYESVMQMKQLKEIKEIESKMEIEASRLAAEKKQEELIKKEADRLIEYYGGLCEAAEKRKKIAEENYKKISSYQLEPEIIQSVVSIAESEATSNESFSTAVDDQVSTVDVEEAKTEENVTEHENLDIINANTDDKVPETIQMAIDNFATAREIKRKVMTEDLGILKEELTNRPPKTGDLELTAAQRNKLKVLSSEFDIEVVNRNVPVINVPRQLTDFEKNKMNVLSSNECFYPQTLDNASYLNKNMKRSLSLNIKKDSNRNKMVMSVDSTPLSDCTTPSSIVPSSIDTNLPTTAETQATDDGGSVFFEQAQAQTSSFELSARKPARFSRYLTSAEATSLIPCTVPMYLKESIEVPLKKHRELIEIELKRFFIVEEKFLQHLKCLQDYFFLCNGTFSRIISESLFERLYKAKKPLELINIRTLYALLNDAVTDTNGELNEFSERLSFKIGKVPDNFDLGNPNVLKSVSLTYKVEWPLNIILHSSVLGKYNEVFIYLLKLNRVSWVLNKIFMDMKLLAKESGKKQIYLMMSPQYRKVHQSRHVMLHCVQCLQNHFVGEVLQNSRAKFEEKLRAITSWEDINEVHTSYVKDVMSKCLLTQKMSKPQTVIHKIFTIILKFYDYLRTRQWECVDGAYVHPNFSKLEMIFENYEAVFAYLFKVLNKYASVSINPELLNLIDLLNVNDYYTKK